jgi:predicted secreted acid phosphatase
MLVVVMALQEWENDKEKRNSSQEELNKLKLEEQSKYNDLFLKQQRQLEDDRISTMQDGYEITY